jgi:hypothetical protein
MSETQRLGLEGEKALLEALTPNGLLQCPSEPGSWTGSLGRKGEGELPPSTGITSGETGGRRKGLRRGGGLRVKRRKWAACETTTKRITLRGGWQCPRCSLVALDAPSWLRSVLLIEPNLEFMGVLSAGWPMPLKNLSTGMKTSRTGQVHGLQSLICWQTCLPYICSGSITAPQPWWSCPCFDYCSPFFIGQEQALVIVLNDVARRRVPLRNPRSEHNLTQSFLPYDL